MQVSTFSRISVIAISLFTMIFVATMYYVVTTLSNSRKQQDEYQNLKSIVSVKLYRTVSQYLQSGDASLLSIAETQLSDIENSSKKIQLPALEKKLTHLLIN